MQITDETYELQGLLQLFENRKDLPSDFTNLIVAKAESILRLARQLSKPKESDGEDNIGNSKKSENFQTEDLPDTGIETGQYTVPEQRMVSERATTPEKHPGHEQTDKSDRTLRLSINDRIRFSRELFGGETRLLDSTLAFMADLEEWDDAEDYFYSDLGWDPARHEVAEFLDILKFQFSRSRH